MVKVRRARTVLAASVGSMVAAATLFAAAPASASGPPTGCDPGDVCFYSGKNYGGKRCSWENADPDTLGGTISCSWMKDGVKPKSVYNNGNDGGGKFTGVAYYRDTNYGGGRIGCTKNHDGGDIAGTYIPRSLKWVGNKCG